MLIVDDEKFILAGLQHMIQRLNTPFDEILTAQSGQEALTVMERERPALVLADVVMPGMTGLEMIEQAKERKLCARYIIISGRQDFAFVRQALHTGVIDYLLKPVDQEELRTLIMRCAEKIRADSFQQDTRNPYVRSACEFIRNNYAKPLNLSDIAAQLGLNANYLSGLFKREMGITISAYLTRCRLDEAKRLLRERTDINVDCIGEMAGFGESRQFYKAFKAATGLTPRQYAMNPETLDERGG